MIFTPRDYQWLIHNFILNHERCNVFASMGMGKTSASVATYQTMRMLGESKRALVLAPRRVALSSWPDEVVKWKESLGDVSMAAAIGTPDQRLAALRATADITTINYDNIEWLIETMGDHWPWDTVFADESTRLKGLRISLQRRKRKDGTLGDEFLQGQGAVRARRLAHIAHKKVRRWINLTGSPAPNGLQDTWGQQWFIDHGNALGNSFTAFLQRWFHTQINDGVMQIRPNAFAKQEIERLMRRVSLTVDAKDYFDVAAPIEKIISVDLPPKARQHYREMERELFTEIEENPVEAFNNGAKRIKCLQLAAGAIITDRETGAWVRTHDEKIEALKSIVEETNGEPLLISYQFVADRERILKAFPRFKTLDQRGAQKDFEAGLLPGLVVHPQSAGHGLNLQQHCRTLVDFNTGIDLEQDEQVIERIGPVRQAQIGKECAVFRYRIVARGTIEQTVNLPRLKTKATLQDAFKDAMKISR